MVGVGKMPSPIRCGNDEKRTHNPFHMALSPISFQGRIAALLETLLQIGMLDIHLALLLIARFLDPLFLVTCLFGVKNITA